jgi:Fe-S oxidoreductase
MGGVDASHQGLFTSLATLEAQGSTTALGAWHSTRPGIATGEDVVFFPGTAALLDAFFRREAEYAAGPHGALLLIGAADLRPLIVGGGSGHDLYYQGRLEEFEALKLHILPALEEALERTGGGPVVCASAEDAHALGDLYGVDAVHISEFLMDRDIALSGTDGPRPRVAFFDPCRLGRYHGSYDAPRKLLARVADVVDLGYERGSEPCCGVSSWTNCNAWSKAHREAILRRAHEREIEVLVTACPMCQVHLDCYYSEEGYDRDDPDVVPPLRIADLGEIVSELGGLMAPDRERLAVMGPIEGSADAGLLDPLDPGDVLPWLDDGVVTASHLCTECMRCIHVCPQNAPVLEHVQRARAGIWDNGRSPAGVAAMVRSVDTSGNPFDEPVEGRTEAFSATLSSRTMDGTDGPSPEVLLYLGCVMSYQDPKGVRAVGRVLEAAGVDFGVLGDGETCCGYMVHLAGAEEEFETIATATAEKLALTGARKLVTPCPGCFKTFSQLYPDTAPGWPGEMEVLHLSEYLDDLVHQGRLSFKEGGEVTIVAYHDPCDLGRHSGVYDAPRRVLSAVPGVVVEEFPESREDSRCCGGGGGLRAFDADMSQELAKERLATLVEGIDAVVSACPSCKGNLRLGAVRHAKDGGPRLRVLDMSEVLASSLEGGDDR